MNVIARTPARVTDVSRPSAAGTMIIWVGVLLAWSFSPNGIGAAGVAQIAAQIVMSALVLSFILEFLRSPKNLLRLDVLMLLALFGLTLLEFFFDQRRINQMLTKDAMIASVNAVLLGIISLSIGRHVPFPSQPPRQLELKPRTVFRILVVCFFLGISYMLLSVNLNPIRLVSEMTGARFTQSWTRARLGGFGDLLHEVQLLLYLVPAIAGIIQARHQRYKASHRRIALLFLGFVLFYGLTSGTRNVFFVFVITYVVAYFLGSPKISRARFARMGLIAALVLMLTSQLVLEFRNVGFQRYFSSILSGEEARQTNLSEVFFIDYNLLTLGRVVEYFSRTEAYLGWEVPIWAISKPIPRVLWRGKPEGLSVAIEDVRSERGAKAATWAATYLGEAYMAAGNFGIVVASLFFGIWSAWWNTRLRSDNDEFVVLLYAAGVFAALISMRSLFWFTTALLPLIALYVMFAVSTRRRKVSRSELLPSRHLVEAR